MFYREESNKALQIVRGLDGTLQQATANQLLMNAIRLNVSEFEQQIQAVINNVSVPILKHMRSEDLLQLRNQGHW